MNRRVMSHNSRMTRAVLIPIVYVIKSHTTKRVHARLCTVIMHVMIATAIVMTAMMVNFFFFFLMKSYMRSISDTYTLQMELVGAVRITNYLHITYLLHRPLAHYHRND